MESSVARRSPAADGDYITDGKKLLVIVGLMPNETGYLVVDAAAPVEDGPDPVKLPMAQFHNRWTVLDRE